MRRILVLSLLVNLAGVSYATYRYVVREPPPRGRADYRAARVSLFAVLRTPDTVLLGDSLTDGGEWNELLGLEVANRGISGDTTEDVLARLDDILARQPRTIALLIGVNDLIRGRSVDETVAGIGRIVARIKLSAPSTKVIVQSLLPAARSLGDLNKQITAVNAKISTSSTYQYLDVSAALRGRDGTLEARFTNDGLHLTGAGYQAWAAVLAPAIKP